MLFIVVAIASAASLPAPSRLLVEWLPLPPAPELLVLSTPLPRFSFLPHSKYTHPGDGVAMSKYRIVVRAATSLKPVWDSGIIAAKSATSVQCGVNLTALTAYEWTAMWWSTDGRSSPISTSYFELGPLPNGPVWASAPWIGAKHQQQFMVNLNEAPPVDARVRVYVAATGGYVIEGHTDNAGVSPRTNFDSFVPFDGHDITPGTNSQSSIVIQLGAGFGAPCEKNPKAACYTEIGECVDAHNCKASKVGVTPFPVAKIVVVVDGKVAKTTIKARRGTVVRSNPFSGGVFDQRNKTTSDPWAPAWTNVSSMGPYATPGGAFRALAMPRATTRPSIAKEMNLLSTVRSAQKWKVDNAPASATAQYLYSFSRNIVGHAVVSGKAYSLKDGFTSGNLTLTYCELMNGTRCLCLRHLCNSAKVQDTFLIDKSTTGPLSPMFSWHGFQYVIVTTNGGVIFDLHNDSLDAVWTTADLEQSATIEFKAGDGITQLSAIRDITKASQLSNMAAYLPTDCPTREKHSWTGDASVTAEQAMYNVFNPAGYELFLDTARAGQGAHGNIAMAVPSRAGLQNRPSDISWSAGYPQTANWLLKYYGDIAIIKDHWPALRKYVDGQQVQTAGAGNLSVVPHFFSCGDWCAIEARSISVQSTGPPAAAANYILAVQAMAEMASALGDSAAHAHYAGQLDGWKASFHRQFYNATMGSYTSRALEVQSLSSIALGAGAVPETLRATVLQKGLVQDIKERNFTHTIGSTGAKWLLPTLAVNGKHEVALKLAAQTAYPSFGWWLDQGATTCWENWSGVCDPSHPPAGGDFNPPTHNHIFLCGGVAEWQYKHIGGIQPTSPGYATVSIAPSISKTTGPSDVAMALETVRGLIVSNWTRAPLEERCFVELSVSVPVGVLAKVAVPLLGHNGDHLFLETGDGEIVWSDQSAGHSSSAAVGHRPAWLRGDGVRKRGDVVEVLTHAGEFNLRMCIAAP